MAEPESPRPPDNGDENTLDRTATPLRGAARPNMGLALLVGGVILVGGLWYALSGEEEFGPDGRPRSVDPQDPAVIPLPPAPPQQPPATLAPPGRRRAHAPAPRPIPPRVTGMSARWQSSRPSKPGSSAPPATPSPKVRSSRGC